MSVGRRQASLTILADGSVLATGGQSSSVNGLVDLQNPVFAAERWDPATGTWRVLSSASRVRQYHSAATLLPDGRVLTGGGGICGDVHHRGLPGEEHRVLLTALSVHQGWQWQPRRAAGDRQRAGRDRIRAHVPDLHPAGRVDRQGGSRPSRRTDPQSGPGPALHPPDLHRVGVCTDRRAPATRNIAPPGYYMLFVTDTAGVPSVAKIVKLDPAAHPLGATATRSDYNSDRKTDLAVWRPSTGAGLFEGSARPPSACPPISRCRRTTTATERPTSRCGEPSNGEWHVRGEASIGWGSAETSRFPPTTTVTARPIWRCGGRHPGGGTSAASAPRHSACPPQAVHADYNGDGAADTAVWRP